MPLPGGTALGRGVAMTYLSIIVLLPLAAVAVKSLDGGIGAFFDCDGPKAMATFRGRSTSLWWSRPTRSRHTSRG